MNGRWALSLLLLAGCADVIGADFEGKELEPDGLPSGGASSQGGGAGGTGAAAGGGHVVINEVYVSRQLTFVELYNAGTATIDLSDYRLVHGNGTAVPGNLSGTVATGAFHVLSDDCAPASCELKLDTAGDNLELRQRGAGTLVDSVLYPASGAPNAPREGESFARVPNGTGSFVAASPTQGKENRPAPP